MRGVCEGYRLLTTEDIESTEKNQRKEGFIAQKACDGGRDPHSSEFVQNDKVAANAGAASVCIGGPPQKAIPYKGKKREEGGASWC